jgi:2-octaprenylphenol hydroxylase
MDFDVVIVGGGLVGASLALALKESGLNLALVESQAPEQIPSQDWDRRVYALSPGSVAYLERIGVWAELPRARLTPVTEMQVFGDDGTSRIVFSAYEAHLAELAFIVENRLLVHALDGALADQENLTLFRPAQCQSLEWEQDYVHLLLADSRRLRARLVVGADGPDSWVRAQSAIEVDAIAYQQSAVVANFRTEKPHQRIARQWFRRDGVLAYLPLPENRISIVYSTEEAHARELLALPAEEFCARIAKTGQHSLGGLELLNHPATFPLARVKVRQLALPRLALIGDAAHVIHPLAGQGVNLGFRDASELSEVLASPAPNGDCGDYARLRRYERARKEDILVTTWLTDSLKKLFNNDNFWLSALRNRGLLLTDSLPIIKDRLVRHALS